LEQESERQCLKHNARRASCRLGFQPDHQAYTAPKLNSVIDDKAFRLLDCLGIVGANQRLEPYKMTVAPDGISPVLCHPVVPTAGCNTYTNACRAIAFIKSFRCNQPSVELSGESKAGF
jgi:hypothetical protein